MNNYKEMQSISDSLNEIEKDAQSEEINKFKKVAEDYAQNGFDREMILELLNADGCSKESSQKIANIVLDGLPDNYDEGPPKSFNDIESNFEKAISSVPVEKWEEYFKGLGVKQLSKVPEMVVKAKDAGSSMMKNEIRDMLEPHIEDLIVKNSVVSEEKDPKTASKREELEMELFGVWPVCLMNKYKKRILAEKEISHRTKKRALKRDIPLIF